MEPPRFGTPGPQIAVAHSDFSNVDARQWDTALQAVAVAAAVDLLASLGSELPVRVFRGQGPQRQQLPLPVQLRDPSADGYGLADWSYRALMSWLMRGNLFGEVLERGPGGTLRQVELFHPDTVSGWMENGQPRFHVMGREIRQTNMVHRRAYPVPGQILGRSPIEYHASTIGVNLSSTAYGQQWFREGAHPSSVLSSTERQVNETLAKQVKDRFMAALRGRREPVVLDRGWEWTSIQVNPEESQFLETQGYSAAESARIFGPGIAEVLGYETGGSLTYSNIQDRDIHLLKYSLNKWLRRLERLLSEFLPSPQYVLLNRDALLQTNTLSRYQAHASALTQRWRTVNEIRAIEDLPPVSWGNEPNATPGVAPAEQDEPSEEDAGGGDQ